ENLVRGRDEVVVEDVVVVETFEQEPHARVDLLFVVDHTGSMAEEQAALSASLDAFVLAIEDLGLAYQIGVVSTSLEPGEYGVLHGEPWIITPATDDPVEAFRQALEVGTEGNDEAGLAAMVAALTDDFAIEENRGFRRSDAGLHVIVLSDDDDASDEVLGSDPVEAALDVLDGEAVLDGALAQFSAVIGNVPDGCRGDGGEAFPGTRYAEVAASTGGVVASICEPDLGDVVEDLAALTAQYPTRFALQALPDGDVRVAVDGTRVDEGWTVESDPPVLVFDVAPQAGTEIQVRYTLAAE
ncbi:MAG: hypothetical protein GY884_19140, partial [Proteobacteria bacterium]|nr:hypothetical protein [Pseudomonadota bacterium]